MAEGLDLLGEPSGVCLWAALDEPVLSKILVGGAVPEDAPGCDEDRVANGLVRLRVADPSRQAVVLGAEVGAL